VLSTVTSAADLEVVPEPVITNWAGWYAGVNVGYGVSNDPDVGVTGTEFFLSDVTDLDGFPDEFDPTYELLSRRLNVDASGVFGGGQVGYNWQDGEYVYGVEADIQFSDIKGKDSASVSDSYDFGIGLVRCPNPRGGLGACVSGQDFGAVAAEQKLKWYSTVRGRIGVAPFEGLLFYATGGVAFGKIKNRAYSGPFSCRVLWRMFRRL
jgi:outer membrane immunogenic protein